MGNRTPKTELGVLIATNSTKYPLDLADSSHITFKAYKPITHSSQNECKIYLMRFQST